MSLSNAFTAYVDAPSDATLRPLHRAIVGSPNFSRATTWLFRATELAAADRHDEVIRLVEGLMPGALFCPDAHALLSTAYAGIGDRGRARREAFYAGLAVEAILASGDGSKARPWVVLHVPDEYAALARFGLAATQQRAVDVDGLVHDELTLSDGSTRWCRFAA